MARSSPAQPARECVGWREWLALPELGIDWILAKVDTGARSSSLHAWDIECFERDGVSHVRFTIHPIQRNAQVTAHAEAPVIGRRKVRSSNGRSETRWLVRTPVRLLGQEWPIELTLTRRDAMGYRMLLGREAVRRRFLVDPGRSYLSGRPPRAIRELARRRRP